MKLKRKLSTGGTPEKKDTTVQKSPKQPLDKKTNQQSNKRIKISASGRTDLTHPEKRDLRFVPKAGVTLTVRKRKHGGEFLEKTIFSRK